MARKRISPLIAKKVGDWNGALAFMSRLGYRVKTVTVDSQYEICKKLKAKVVAHIRSQDLSWKPLAPRTRELKKKNKDLILQDTELLLKSISVWREGNSSFVGIKKGKAYRRRGSFVSVDKVAVLLEMGTTKMPARPVWTPSINELGGAKGIRDYIASRIYEKLLAQSKGSPVKITKSQLLKMVR